MRRWSNVRALLSTARRRPNRPILSALLRLPIRLRYASTYANSPLKDQTYQSTFPSRKYDVFDKIHLPHRQDANAWVALLDGALPPHLRNWSSGASPPNLSAVDVAEILLAAQHPPDPNDSPLDLLFHLGFEQDRWSAVVWLVKKLVDKFPARHQQRNTLTNVNALWESFELSDTSPGAPILDLPSAAIAKERSPLSRSLDELTEQPAELVHREALQHDALGQVWRSLGNMTKACAGQDIRPEVLEILAYLHHREVMPMSIYQSQTHPDKSAIQQPPLLSTLSSRILTSLSDAAWRAHEKLVIEETKAKGGEYAALRPEVPGSVYRVHVAGLRPEVWMELILWSCIHGGWSIHGADILRSIVKDERWKPLSWREYEREATPETSDQSHDWADWEYMFKTRSESTRDAPDGPEQQVDRTISAEVINAYVDVLVSSISAVPASRALGIADVVLRLHELRSFLRQPEGPNLSLSMGSWDALAIRLIEAGAIDGATDHNTLQSIVSLSLRFGQALTSPSTRDLPDYVLDGNLALQGLLHRALDGQINNGSVEGAIEVFTQIQERADADKRCSLKELIANSTSFVQAIDRDGMFMSNLPGIEYPAFRVQIPPPILASFLELMTDAKQWKIARWLVENDEMDGPIIDERLYLDPHVQPAVVRFAAESRDNGLMRKLRSLSLSNECYQAVFDMQVNAGRWAESARVLRYLPNGVAWSIRNLANLIRVMMSHHRKATAGDKDSAQNLFVAKAMFAQMVRGKYDTPHARDRATTASVRSLLFVLAAVRDEWVNYSVRLLENFRHQQFSLRARDFNLVLDGVVSAYGSAVGQQLVEKLWPKSVRFTRNFKKTEDRWSSSGDGAPLDQSWRPRITEVVKRQRLVVPLAGHDRDFVMSGSLKPNTQTILIVLRKAIEEITAAPSHSTGSGAGDWNLLSESDPRRVALWAVNRLHELPYVSERVISSLDKEFAKKGLDELRQHLPQVATFVPKDPVVRGNSEVD